MPVLLVRHKVTNFLTWRPHFDEHSDSRRANGCLGARLFRNAADPDEVLLLFDWDDLERARLFVQSDDLQEAMVRSGVADEPDVWFLDDLGSFPV